MADVVSKTCDKKVQRGRKKVVCGQAVPDNEPTAITVGTTRYLMDLCQEHQDELLSAVEPFTSIAHDAQKRLGTQVRKAIKGRGGKAFTAADVREWLKEQGREVSGTGRLPSDLIREFEEAHS
ncbi:histone-like nucleoid-structuring protein Lsr2 [Streptomyces sp. NPDC002088]|uniref:Lsr2 family DNA-binding protein n=1 Tax=Streptomyces sp. NPDC002088 TaxID=3154665 RepID=UPI003318B8D9